MSWHIHEVYSWWCWYILMINSWWVVYTWLKHTWYMVGCTCLWYRLITGWCIVDALVYGTGWLQVGAWLMHLFMEHIGYRLVHGWCNCLWYRLITGWCMVYALVYGTGWLQVDAWLMHGSYLLVQVYSSISHSDSVTVVPSFYFYFRVVGRGKERWL